MHPLEIAVIGDDYEDQRRPKKEDYLYHFMIYHRRSPVDFNSQPVFFPQS